jgi:hypothetical protein
MASPAGEGHGPRTAPLGRKTLQSPSSWVRLDTRRPGKTTGELARVVRSPPRPAATLAALGTSRMAPYDVGMQLNPYPRGSARPEKYLFGRANEIQAIENFTREVQTRQASDMLCFLAPAGLGKTSLLKLARRRLQRAGWFCGYSEASSDATTSMLDLLADAGDALPPEGMGARFRSRLDELSLTAGPVGIGFKLSASTDEATSYTRLTRLLSGLGRLALSGGVGVALIIDEAQALPSADIALLMRVVARLDDLPIAVLIGGLPRVPRRLTPSSDFATTQPSLWYDTLSCLGPEDSCNALVVPAADAGCTLDADALDLLTSFAAGHPLLLQMAGSAAWRAASPDANGDQVRIAARHAEQALGETAQQLTLASYEPLWAVCSPAEKQVLRLLAPLCRDRQGVQLTELRTAVERDVDVDVDVDAVFALAGNGVIWPLRSPRSPVQFVLPGFAEYILQR